MRMKGVLITVIFGVFSFTLSAKDNFERLLEKYKNVTGENLLVEREKKQTDLVLKETLNSVLFEGMISVPEKKYAILRNEVTQEFYELIMGKNPSEFKGEKNFPIENISWYDAVEFCNKLSEKLELVPAYFIHGHNIEWNKNANGYRLPTLEEWQYAAKGGQEFKYSGSDNIDEVAWYEDNSGRKTHSVAQKKSNGYGLYDMSGNVWEWCWDLHSYNRHYCCGGSWYYYDNNCNVSGVEVFENFITRSYLGFRIVRNIDE